MGKPIWQCTNCDKYLDGNPIICSHCGYTVYRPVYSESVTGLMPGSTKPTTSLTREELLIEIQNIDTAGSVVKNEITGTAMKTIMQYVDIYTQAKEREARISELAKADIAMDPSGINETEEWETYFSVRRNELTTQEVAN